MHLWLDSDKALLASQGFSCCSATTVDEMQRRFEAGVFPGDGPHSTITTKDGYSLP
jgi:hypothetical protein